MAHSIDVFTSLAIIAFCARQAVAINCYTCSSVNGTNPNCHDPFHPAHARYVIDCTVPKDGHVGRFPAHFCVKVVGRTMDTNVEMVIRICSLETMDNSCGVFRYGDDILRGCILTCNNDGCNTAPPPLRRHAPLAFLLAVLASSRKVLLTHPL
ncbi:UPAR/Ly6 domain-containing protein bou-like [Amblyomma americanum]